MRLCNPSGILHTIPASLESQKHCFPCCQVDDCCHPPSQIPRPSPINSSSNSKCLGSRVNYPCLASSFHTVVFARQDFILRSVKAILRLLKCLSSGRSCKITGRHRSFQSSINPFRSFQGETCHNGVSICLTPGSQQSKAQG